MTTFNSVVKEVGETYLFPKYSGTRVMMMPIDFARPLGSMPDSLIHYSALLIRLIQMSGVSEGIGYITIDEADVPKGETHRRPGIHVDGIGPDGSSAPYGGGGGGYGANGMLLVASKLGCRAWNKEFTGWPENGGDCEHLKDQCTGEDAIDLEANKIYYLNPMAVHEPLPVEGRRQFIRLSYPNDSPWHENYTENPTGVKPAGPILPARTEQMNYRSK